MQYRDSELRYESETDGLETTAVRQHVDHTKYRRKRAIRARRRTSKTADAHPGCGIGGRRNHRWTW